MTGRVAVAVLMLVVPAACKTRGTVTLEAGEPCPGKTAVDVDVYVIRGQGCPVEPADLCLPFSCPLDRCELSCTSECSLDDLDAGLELEPPAGAYAVVLDFLYEDGSYGFSCAEIAIDADGTQSNDAVVEVTCCP